MFIFFSGAFGAKLGLHWLLAWLGLAWLCHKKRPAPWAPYVHLFLWRLQRQTWLGLALGLAWLGLAWATTKIWRLRHHMLNFFLWRLRRQTWLGVALGLAWLDQKKVWRLRRHMLIFFLAPSAPNLAWLGSWLGLAS